MKKRQVQAVGVKGQTVLAKLFAVIRCDHDDRVVESAAPLQDIEQRPNLLVDVGNRAVIPAEIGLVRKRETSGERRRRSVIGVRIEDVQKREKRTRSLRSL